MSVGCVVRQLLENELEPEVFAKSVDEMSLYVSRRVSCVSCVSCRVCRLCRAGWGGVPFVEVGVVELRPREDHDLESASLHCWQHAHVELHPEHRYDGLRSDRPKRRVQVSRSVSLRTEGYEGSAVGCCWLWWLWLRAANR